MGVQLKFETDCFRAGGTIQAQLLNSSFFHRTSKGWGLSSGEASWFSLPRKNDWLLHGCYCDRNLCKPPVSNKSDFFGDNDTGSILWNGTGVTQLSLDITNFPMSIKWGCWICRTLVSLVHCDNPWSLSSVINPLQPDLRQTATEIYLHMVVAWAPAPQHVQNVVLARKGTSVLQLWNWDMWSLLKSC